MCNAHNHKPGCNCRWGQGINFSFSGKSQSTYNYIEQTDYATKVIEKFPPQKFSITIPNAKYPVCHSPVFFYQNLAGSRVFFDSLGIPWPKHPCTDKSEYSTKINTEIKFYDLDFYFIPERNINLLSNNIELNHNIKANIFLEDFYNVFDGLLFASNNIEYLLLGTFKFKPDIILLVERNNKLFLETYEIAHELSQSISLMMKSEANIDKIKYFALENGDELYIKINYTHYTKTEIFLCRVELINYSIEFDMKLSNFSEENIKDIRLMKHVRNKDFNLFKVRFFDNELFEI